MRLELVNTPFGGYYNAERYIIVDAEERMLGTVREMPVKSVIAWPAEGQVVAHGAHTVFGFAWSGLGQISQVEVKLLAPPLFNIEAGRSGAGDKNPAVLGKKGEKPAAPFGPIRYQLVREPSHEQRCRSPS